MSRSVRGIKLAGILGLLVSSSVAFAEGRDDTTIRTLMLDLSLNGQGTGRIAKVLHSEGAGMKISRGDLVAAGIRPPGSGRPDALVDLARIRGLTATYDEPRQVLSLTVTDPALLKPRRASGEDPLPRAPASPAETGLVVNYTLFGQGQSDKLGLRPTLSGGSVSLDARLFSLIGVLEQTGIVGTTLFREADIIRLDTRFTLSSPETPIVGRLGDVVTLGPQWSRPVRLGGAQVARDYVGRTDIVTAAVPVLSGSAAAPSTLDVYVNGVKTFSQDVAAGAYSLSNVPGLSGAGTAQVVLRDATGREIKSSLPFFTAAQLLQRGVFDYSFQVGVPRFHYATPFSTYGKNPVAVAAARYGLTDTMTLETYNEAGGGLANAGVGANAALLNYGILGLNARLSHSGRGVGAVLGGSFDTTVAGITLAAGWSRALGRYEDLVSTTARLDRPGRSWSLDPFASMRLDSVSVGQSPAIARETQRLSLSGPLPWAGGTLGLGAVRQVYDAQPERRLLTASLGQRLGQWSFFATGFTDLAQKRSAGVFAGLSVTLGKDLSANTALSGSHGSAQASTEVVKSLGTETGSYGARARLGYATNVAGGAGVSYLADFVKVMADVDATKSGATASAVAEGAIIATRRGLTLSRRVDDGFAVVDAGLPGVVILHEGRPIGVTDRNGRFVVPSLFANAENRISVDVNSLGPNASLAQTQATVVPRYRSGVSVDLGGREETPGAYVRLVTADGKPMESGYSGKVDGTDQTFVTGSDGASYVRGLTERSRLVVSLEKGPCQADVAYVAKKDEVVTVGPVVCR